ERGVAGEDEHEPVAFLDGHGLDAEVGLLVPEQVVRARGATIPAVGPAVIRADQTAIDDLAFGELEMAMRAAVLDRTHATVLAAKHRDRAPPELGLDHLAVAQRRALLDGVPVVGIEPGSAHFLAARTSLFEGRRRTGSVPVERGHEWVRR